MEPDGKASSLDGMKTYACPIPNLKPDLFKTSQDNGLCLLLVNTQTKYCPCGSFGTSVFHKCDE